MARTNQRSNTGPKLQKYPELASLQKVRIIHLKNGEFGNVIIVEHTRQKSPKNNLSRLTSVLNSVDGTQDAYFWFAEESKTLILETSREALKKEAQKIGVSGVRGKLLLSKRGSLEFRIKQEAPGLLKSLAGFVSKNIQDWPDLKKMNGAYVAHRNSAGETISRQKSQTLWSFLKTDSQ